MLEKTSSADAQLDQERLHSLVNSMADGVIALDEKGTIVLYNGAALNILDVNTTIKDQPIDRCLPLIDASGTAVDVKKMILETKTSTASRDLRLLYPDGSSINLYISIAPVHLGYGVDGTRGFVVLVRDITHEKSLEEERNEFISVVSHELRTPIAIAEGNIGNAEFILEKTQDLAKIKEVLHLAHEQVVFLADMINDLSTLSRAERGKLQADREAINVAELLQELHKTYLPSAQKKGLELHVHTPSDLEILYSGKLYVREILQNFITNAIKYTEAGSVSIAADPKQDGVVFEVSDTGIGISRKDQERIFEKFFRVDNEKTRAQNGTGLGLYVTMKLTRMLKAEISIDSELGHGSTFRIFIPNMPEPKDTDAR